MYKNFLKRILDFTLSLCAIIVLSPVLLVLTVLGWIKMKGNPFFVQRRPGKHGKIFKLIKFRSMTCQRDSQGKLLPDAQRLTRYGKFLRATSLDELPELINILIGDMSIVGPRPLAIEYLPYYTSQERHRHDVRPGLTGLAQVNGRNALTWEQKFAFDLEYVNALSFLMDIKVLFMTVKKVLVRDGIDMDAQVCQSLHRERADWILAESGAIKQEPVHNP